MNELFLLDELYNKTYSIENYPQENNLEKFLYYKYQKNDGIDPDASEIMMKIHLDGNQLFDKDKSYYEKYAWRKYQIINNGTYYRGDTIFNCMELLLQIANNYREGRKNEKIDVNSLKKTDFYLRNEDLINNFIYWCYNPGNMCVVPFSQRNSSLNIAKEYLSQPGYKYCIKDSADCFFRVLANYFTDTQTSKSKEKIEERLDNDKKYRAWRERYHGHIDKFISDNCFQPFFEGNVPKPFFIISEEGFEADIKEYMKRVINALKERTRLLMNPVV